MVGARVICNAVAILKVCGEGGLGSGFIFGVLCFSRVGVYAWWA